MITDKQLAHFLVYVYVCIAKSDFHLVDEEVSTIVAKLKKHEKYKHLDTESVLHEALAEHASHTEDEMFKHIDHYTKKICRTEDDKQLLLSDLEDIVEADGVVKDLEMTMYRRIKQILA